ncbi:MAG TPA: choline kinase family protein [Solirubrobacterales bacterium]|jgi:thiamine kinase-like enzyme|nr:choline kinase family protein [Solirubrobacterales bacterium]
MASLEETLGPISARLGEIEGDPVPLEGGITNRNYRVRFAGEDLVVRLPGKDTELLEIDRGAEKAAGELAASAGVGPEVVAMLDDPRCLVTRFVEGEPTSAAELREPVTLAEVAGALRTLHSREERLPVAFSCFRIVEAYAARMADRGAEVPSSYEWAMGAAHRVEAALVGPEHDPVPCHNDLLAANFIRSPQGVRIIDWEYAGMGDRYFDLGNFAVNNELDEGMEANLLGAYFESPASDRRLATLRLMRFMSDFREAMWGALQSTISELEFDFGAYCAEHFDRMREAAGEGRLEELLEEAGGAAG